MLLVKRDVNVCLIGERYSEWVKEITVFPKLISIVSNFYIYIYFKRLKNEKKNTNNIRLNGQNLVRRGWL